MGEGKVVIQSVSLQGSSVKLTAVESEPMARGGTLPMISMEHSYTGGTIHMQSHQARILAAALYATADEMDSWGKK